MVAGCAIDSLSALVLNTGGEADLNFSGIQTVASLSLGGVTELAGIYNASSEPAFFSGTGEVEVAAVPEPEAYGLLMTGGLLGLMLRRRKMKFTATKTTAQSGFTMIEMLTVIAVIAILAALLMPAIQKGKAAANATKCTQHLRSLISASLSYAQDNHQNLPTTSFMAKHGKADAVLVCASRHLPVWQHEQYGERNPHAG